LVRPGTAFAFVEGERERRMDAGATGERSMKNTMKGLAVASLLALAACGGDSDRTPTTPVVPPTPITNYSGTYANSQLWLVAFERASDGWRSQYYCPGTMTLAQGATSGSSAPLTGFGVVTAPCPSLTFTLTGTVNGDGTVSFATDGPRPLGCPAKTATYSGLFTNRQLSARGSTSIDCSGVTEGTHRFDYVITAFKNN
jgi:hypothetical protein